jgi:hypothetical protein
MTTDERIAALEAKIDVLQATIAKLGQRDSMHKTLTCPACGNGRVLAVKQINEQSGGDTGAPLTLGSYRRWFDGPEGDPLYAYVCTACRLVEWHVYSLVHLAPDGETVRELWRPAEGAAPSNAPYR